jgi:hypothetical protein
MGQLLTVMLNGKILLLILRLSLVVAFLYLIVDLEAELKRLDLSMRLKGA